VSEAKAILDGILKNTEYTGVYDEEKMAELSYAARGVGVGQPAGGEIRRRGQTTAKAEPLLSSGQRKKKEIPGVVLQYSEIPGAELKSKISH